jgi:hypothetical protein
MTRALAIVFIVALSSACTAGGIQSNAMTSGSPSASASASASPAAAGTPAQSQVSPSPPAATLIRCEDLPDKTFTSDTFRFTVGCPANFSWQTFGAAPGRLFDARAVDDRYLNGYPAGEVDISTVVNTGNSLRGWVASHIGQVSSGDDNHFWDSTSNLADIQIAGRPALGFDYVLAGPDSPVNFHAAAFVLPQGSVLLIVWWAFSSDYAPTIALVAQQMISSVQPFGA